MYLVTVSLRASNWGMSISAMIRQQDVRHQGATFISRITLKKRWWWFKLLIHQSCSLQSTCHGMKGSQITWQLHFSSKTFVLVVMLSWAKGCYTEIRGGFFFFFFYPYIQASSTQINYLHVHLIPWTFHHAALSTSLPRPLKCSYIWFQTTELLLLKTLKFIQHNTAPARTELCLSLIDLEKDKRHIISFYVDNKSTRNAQYRPTVLNDDFVLVCFNETTFWY